VDETQQERDLEIAKRNTILRVLTGSHAHGLEHPESDLDFTVIFIEPPGHVFGPEEPLENTAWRSVAKKVRSGPGQTEETYFSLRRITELLLRGNPRITPVLYAPDRFDLNDRLGTEFQKLHSAFMSERVALSYLRSAESMLNELYHPMQGKNQRADKVKLFGYDAKFAMHALRHTLQGIELLLTGRLTLPMPQDSVKFLHKVRVGEIDLKGVLVFLEEYVDQLRKLTNECKLSPDTYSIRVFLERAHRLHWQNTNLVPHAFFQS